MNAHIQKIKLHVAAQRRKTIAIRVLNGELTGLFCFFTASILLQTLFTFFPWTSLPLIWDVLLICEIFFSAGWIVVAIINAESLIETASKLEKGSQLQHPLVSIALELNKAGNTDGFSLKTYERAESQTGSLNVHIKDGVSLVRLGLTIPAIFLFCISTLTMNPSLARFWKLPLSYLSSIDGRVVPGSILVARSSSVCLKLIPSNSSYPVCRLTITTLDGKKKNNFYLKPDTSGVFSYKIDGVSNSFVYQFSLGGGTCPPESIQVVYPPSINAMNIILEPPAYTGKSAQKLADGRGDFDAYEGTNVKISIESNPLKTAALLIGKDSIGMKISNSGREASVKFRISDTTGFTFALTDTFGLRNDSLPVFRIGLIPDEFPVVQFIRPARNKSLTPAMVESLWIEGIDDLGIRSMQLHWVKKSDDGSGPGMWDISPKDVSAVVQKQIVWDLKDLSLYPGDTLVYWATVKDSKPFPPYHTANSDTFWFRVPGFEEIQKQISEQQDQTEKTVGDVKEKQDDLEEMIKNLVKSSSGKNELSWEQKRIVEDVKQRIQAQADSLQSALNSLQDNVRQLKEQGTLGEEISKKMDQVRKSLEDLIKQYGDSLLGGMNNREQISLQEMKEAVEKAKDLLPELSERLENTLKYLEALKKDRQLAEMAMRAEKLAEEQADLSQNKKDNSALERQNRLLDRIDNFKKDLSRNLDKHGSDKLSSGDRIDSLSSSMQSQLDAGKMPKSEQMKEMSGSLLSMSQDLRSMMSSERMKQIIKSRERVLDLTNDVLSLAQWQSELRKNPTTAPDDKKAAQTQQSINDALKNSFSRTDSLQIIPPDLQGQIRKQFRSAMESGESVIGNMAFTNGSGAMRRSENSLNSLANTLIGALSSLDQMQSQGSESGSEGMMGGLRRLSGRQAAINAATGDLLRSLMQGSQSPEGNQGSESEGGKSSEEARKAARQAQEALAEELKKLAQKYGNENGGDAGKRVEELEREARRLASELEHPTPDISEHQERFLSRMLQATLSIHNQDEGKDKRKSKSAETVFTPQETPEKPGELYDIDAFHLLRKKALLGNFPDQYRASVKSYFDKLSEMFLKEK